MNTAERTARGLRRVPASSAEKASSGPEKKRRRIKYNIFAIGAGMDMPLFFLILILLAIGLVMLFSASYAYCYFYFGNSYFFIQRQAMFAIVGVVAMLLVSTFDYHHFHKLAWPLFGVAVLLLLLVLVFKDTAIVQPKNGAYRWINFGFVEFQPSEIAKFSMILVFAHMISQRVPKMGTFKEGFLPFAGVLSVFAGLVIAEKHMSATIIIALIGLIMMFIGGVKVRYFVIIFGVGVAGVLYLLFMSGDYGHSLGRLTDWLDPFSTWQTRQSLYAIGSGQLLGLGLGQSRQKYLYLPEPQNDFIFAIVCEELGFVGALIIIILFGLLIWRGIYVSLRAKDKFGTMLGLGITFQIGIQIVLNICVVTNTVPNTGISLPFFSYGGTALLILLFEMGVLLQVSRSANIVKT